ncbi:LysR family transcriptional regulator [Gallibacterium anatis]|uniref:LysR family transcriptional regulator n=1 Tax=Gallibacterium anatis TaxID=750 RepID=A0A930USF6_9PAST|nr:LysR family transcriptional regulator [Gallibacterium anatis]
MRWLQCDLKTNQYSQATISRRIAKLEQQLGVKLLHRTTHSIKLTNAGALYYPHCVDF